MDRIAAESQLDAAAERLEFLEFIESRKKALPAQSNTNTAVLMMYGVAFLYMFTFPHDFWRFAPLAIVVGIHWVAIR
jgi:hypothetical protein